MYYMQFYMIYVVPLKSLIFGGREYFISFVNEYI